MQFELNIVSSNLLSHQVCECVCVRYDAAGMEIKGIAMTADELLLAHDILSPQREDQAEAVYILQTIYRDCLNKFTCTGPSFTLPSDDTCETNVQTITHLITSDGSTKSSFSIF